MGSETESIGEVVNADEIFALSSIQGIGPKAVSSVVEYLKVNDINSIKDVDVEEMIKHKSVSRYRKILSASLPWNNFSGLVSEAELKIKEIKNKGIQVISIADKEYPDLLKLTNDAPPLLYCRGDISLFEDRKNAAVVGTRSPTRFGKLLAEKTVNLLCSGGYIIVSGLAVGIDSIAHQQALAVGGKCIAVVVDVERIYPALNKDLAENIVSSGGLLVSENIPGTQTSAALLIKRDRIQNGLSLGVFPIETAIDGGTMHAVHAAQRENRAIFTPDIRELPYTDKELQKLGGNKQIIEESIGFPYTKYKYAEVMTSLSDKMTEIFTPASLC